MQAAVAVLLLVLAVVALPLLAAPLLAPDGTVLTNVLDLSPAVAAVGTERLELAHETLRVQSANAAQIEQARIAARTEGVTVALYAAAASLVAYFAQRGATAWAKAWARARAAQPAPPPVLVMHAHFLAAQGHDVDVVVEDGEWVVLDHTRKLLIDAEAAEVGQAA